MFPKSYGSCAIVQFLNAFFSFSGFQNTVLLKSQNQTVRLFAFQLKKKRVCLVKLLGQMTLKKKKKKKNNHTHKEHKNLHGLAICLHPQVATERVSL